MGLSLSRRAERIALVSLLVLCVLWQAFAFVTGRWGMDADESYMGLAGLRIARGEPRVFFFGQNYMGCVEAYGFALVRAVTRTSAPITARIQTALQTLLYLFTAWWLLRRHVGRRAALGGVAFLALPPAFLARWYLRIRGYAPPMILGNLVLLLLFEMRARPGRWTGPRGFFLLGLLLGFGWYANPIGLFHVVAAGLFVLLTPALRRAFFEGLSPKARWVAVANVAVLAAAAMLELRAVVSPRHSPFLQFLYAYRGFVLPALGAMLASGLVPLLSRTTRSRTVPALASLGFLIGHAPALAVYWSLPVLNLKQSAGSLELFVRNMVAGVPPVFATMTGIVEMPALVVIGVAAFYVLMFYIALRRIRSRGKPLLWLLILPFPAYLILAMQNLTVWGMERYFLPFYVCLAAAVGVGISEIGRVAGRWAWLLLAVPVALHIAGVARTQGETVDLPSGVPSREAAYLKACRATGADYVLITEGDDMAMRLSLFGDEKPVFTYTNGYFNRIAEYERLFRSQKSVAVLCRPDWMQREEIPGKPIATVEGMSLAYPVPRKAVNRFVPTYKPPGVR